MISSFNILTLLIRSRGLILSGLFGLTVLGVSAQIPSLLTDKLFKGSGQIDLLKDVSAADLTRYFDAQGGLLLGVDVNENASGVESSSSLGVALQDVSLMLETTAGSYTFSDFFTNTTAEILAAGSQEAGNYFTLFGQGGSSQLTSSTSSFNLSAFDDVLEVQNVFFDGEIVSANLQIDLLETTARAGVNESFFDFSGGFEDFAILSPEDAQILDAAAIGISGADQALTFTTTAPILSEPTPTTTPESGGGVIVSTTAPGAPAPPLAVLLPAAALWWWRQKRQGEAHVA